MGCDRMYGPLLRILKEHPGIHERDVPPLLQREMGLTDEQVGFDYEPGNPEKRTMFVRRMSASLSALRTAKGLTVSDGRGHWRLTDMGESYADPRWERR